MKKLLLLITVLSFIGCSTENTPVFTLTTNTNPQEAGTISPAQGEFDEGSQATITATANQGWIFSGWQGDHNGSSNPATIVMNSDKSVTALFEMLEYELTLDTEGEGTIQEQIVNTKSENYQEGTTIQLTAVPDEGWEFIEWRGDLSGSSNPSTITVDSDKSITAVFEEASYEVTMEVEGEGDIEERIITGKTASYEYGTIVEFTAVPSEGWLFTGWSGDLSGDENPVQVTIEEAISITATFEPEPAPAVPVSWLGTGKSARLNTVQFLSDDLGWVGGEGLIAKTTDGGETWTHQMEDDYIVNEIQMIDENIGFAVAAIHGEYPGTQGIYKTTDGGTNWNLVFETVEEPRALFFTDQNTGWVAGVNDLILKTSDGGDNWVVQDQFIGAFGGVESFWINDLFFLDENHGWGAGHYSPADNRLIIQTTDGGETWEVVYDYMGSPFNFIYMFDEDSGLTGSNRAILRLSNGGENANEIFNHSVFSRVNDVLFLSDSHGYVVGTNFENMPIDYFYVTFDGGNTWNEVNTEDSVSGSSMDIGENNLWITSGPWVVKVEI